MMDTSETYIKMCDCREVRKYTPITTHNGAIWVNAGETTVDIGSDRTVWLPRQDQIQEMMRHWMDKGCSSTPSIYLICNLARFCGFEDEEAEGRSNVSIRKGSLEQLWLAFYMYEVHNKTWEGEGWYRKPIRTDFDAEANKEFMKDRGELAKADHERK